MVKIVRQHRNLAKNAPIGGPQLARIRDFRVFRDFGAHEAELGPPKDFLERIDGRETHTIRQIRACSIRKNS